MNSREKINKLINGRTCCVIARGQSLELLESEIKIFNGKDICWCGLNLFTPAELIIGQIDEKLDFVSDCSNVPNRDRFEKEVRIPRFEDYLKKENNILQISNTVINDLKAVGREDLLETYKNKIITIDEIFTGDKYPKELWNAPPNSITLLFATLIAGQAKKIIVFGLDGHNGTNKDALQSYYRPDLEREERLIATGKEEAGSLVTDMHDFNRRFLNILNIYKKTYNNNDVQIINCSINSYYTCLPKIDYTQLPNFI